MYVFTGEAQGLKWEYLKIFTYAYTVSQQTIHSRLTFFTVTICANYSSQPTEILPFIEGSDQVSFSSESFTSSP